MVNEIGMVTILEVIERLKEGSAVVGNELSESIGYELVQEKEIAGKGLEMVGSLEDVRRIEHVTYSKVAVGRSD